MSQQIMRYQKGMVFGVFDGLHPGHQRFLREANKKCRSFIIVVARSSIVRELKERSPKHSTQTRIATLKKFMPQSVVLAGDKTLESWHILKKHSPDVVFLGYDQTKLGEALKTINQPSLILKPYQPHKYKSTLLHHQPQKTKSAV